MGKEEHWSGGLDLLSKSLGAGVRATPLSTTVGRLPCHLPLVTDALPLPSHCQQAISGANYTNFAYSWCVKSKDTVPNEWSCVFLSLFMPLKKKSWFVPKDTCLPCKFHRDPKWETKTVSSKLVWKCRCRMLKRRKAFYRKAAGEVWVQVDSKPNCSSHSYGNRLGPRLQQTGRILICEPRIKSSHHREQDKISCYI